MEGSVIWNDLIQAKIQEHEILFTCQHKNKVYRKRILSNQAIHYGTQCLRCGQWSALGKKNFPQDELETCGEYDPELVEKFRLERQEHYRDTIGTAKDIQWRQYQEQRNDYYDTPEWKFKAKLRRRVNEKLFNGLCEICFTNKANRIHHLTYDRLYSEYIFDLAALCDECHRAVHMKNPNWAGHAEEE